MAKTTESHRNSRYGKIWKKVFAKYKNCALCGKVKDLCIDHIFPVRLGGKSTLDNLRVLCRSCNTKEGHIYRELNPKLERKRNYMREWAKRNPGYFTFKSRQFRKEHPGYNVRDVEAYYKQALI